MIRCFVIATVLILLNSVELPHVFADERPNIVWIMSEDNSKHYLKHFDEMGAETPNIESLAASGITFDRAFSNAAVCSVARTTLITGVYAPRLGTQFHRKIQLVTMPEGWEMFPALLRKSGYYTTNNSKKDYNAIEAKNVWDESSAKAHWRNRAAGQSFFHVQTFKQSHESSLHFNQDWADAPDNQTPVDSVTLAPYHPDTPLFRLTYAHYHDRIKVIDEKVGELVQQLKADGEFENTIIFYFGDHGGVLPRGKGYIYESGLHVPLVVRVPEKWKNLSPFENGSRTNGFVEFVDFAPTVLNLAGVEVPSHMDGAPFLGGGVTAEQIENDDTAFGYVDRMDEKYDFCRSVRIGDWKYIRNYQAIYPDGLQNNYRYEMLAYTEWRELFKSGSLNAIQQQFFQPKLAEMLFDLSNDPHEVNNLAAQPEHESALVKMRSALTERLKTLPDLSFYPESELVDNALESPIEFGNSHHDEIGALIDVANLAVLPFAEAQSNLKDAVESSDPTVRYWAFSVCSIFGSTAKPFYDAAEAAVADDNDLLVRLRAAEFLGITKQADPVPAIKRILQESDSATINLISLQTLVYFRDGPYEYDTTIDTSTITTINEEVFRRVAYLDGLTQQEIKARMRKMRK